MKINGIDIQKTITDLKEQLSVDTMITPSLKATINVLLVIVSMLCNRLGLNSKNSNKPPSSDPNRTKKKRNYSAILSMLSINLKSITYQILIKNLVLKYPIKSLFLCLFWSYIIIRIF